MVKLVSGKVVQVRIQCIEKCPNLPLKAFKEAMSENFEKKKNKFKYSLDEVQVFPFTDHKLLSTKCTTVQSTVSCK
jgi:hypothetical protein